MNKFEREGYEFSFVEPPFTDELIAELQAVSDSWLGKQVEKGVFTRASLMKII